MVNLTFNEKYQGRSESTRNGAISPNSFNSLKVFIETVLEDYWRIVAKGDVKGNNVNGKGKKDTPSISRDSGA